MAWTEEEREAFQQRATVLNIAVVLLGNYHTNHRQPQQTIAPSIFDQSPV